MAKQQIETVVPNTFYIMQYSAGGEWYNFFSTGVMYDLEEAKGKRDEWTERAEEYGWRKVRLVKVETSVIK